VVINEYYSPPVANPMIRDYSAGNYADSSARPPAPAAPPAPEAAKRADYWLIAFPNGTVTLAVAYWTTGNILHYVSRNKEQKQVPISSIDRELTEQLNSERGVTFRIPK
jgi:hypothetical protein